MTSDLNAFVRALSGAGVQYVIIGGVAANLHGSARTTVDLDIVYSRTPDNVARLVRALAPYAPYLRGAPAGLPFQFDEDTVARGLNFTLTTTIGEIDLLGEVVGGGTYERVQAASDAITLEGFTCWVVNLPTLIALKRAAGRGKDREVLAELEALREERERGPAQR
jgi:predicted nucleotidyltransferase